jgi:hypothetical protein
MADATLTLLGGHASPALPVDLPTAPTIWRSISAPPPAGRCARTTA